MAAADIEERVKRIRSFSTPHILESRWFPTAALLIGFIVFFAVFANSVQGTPAADQLEIAYKNGTVTDPIQAIIFLERAKATNVRVGPSFVLAMILAFAPIAAPYGIMKLLTIIAPSYNFYWGDYIAYLDRRKSAQNIVWTVVILGIIVSIVSSYVLRILP